MPQSLFEDRIKILIANELKSNELLTLITHLRQIKFNEIRLYNVTAEYTDRLDQMLKSTRHLKLFKCNFRQIFPKPMTNEVENIIETVHMEDV